MQESTPLDKRRRKPRAVARGFVLLVIFFTGIIGYQLHDREPQLLARSRRLVVHVDYRGTYYWLSSRELLVLKPANTGFYASMVDVVTGASTHATALSRQLSKADADFSPELSPNRKWLLAQQRGLDSYLRVVLSVVDGQRAPWPQSGPISTAVGFTPEPPAWLPDSAHWLEFMPIDMTGRALLIRHGINEPANHLGTWEPYGLILGQDLKGRLLVYRSEQTKLLKVCLIAYNPASGKRIGETILPMNSNEFLTNISLSPNGNRVAFVSLSGGTQFYPDWLLSHITFLRNASPTKRALWICDVDGKRLHEIGCISEKVVRFSSGADEIRDLKWLPDGKSLSFVLDGKLWVTPAD